MTRAKINLKSCHTKALLAGLFVISSLLVAGPLAGPHGFEERATDVVAVHGAAFASVVGDHAELRRSVDNGAKWSSSNAPYPFDLVHFLDSRRGWAVARIKMQAVLMRTTDGGASWKLLPAQFCSRQDCATITGMGFTDELHGWFVGASARGTPIFLMTSDGGNSLGEVSVDLRLRNPAGVVVDGKNGIWVFGDGPIMHSRDGKNWSTQCPSEGQAQCSAMRISDLTILPTGFGWAVGSPGILRTRDFGNAWTIIKNRPDVNAIFHSVAFPDLHNGFVVGRLPYLLTSNDSGKSWTTKAIPTACMPVDKVRPDFIRVRFSDARHGWLLENDGILCQTDNMGSSWKRIIPEVR